MKKILLFVLVTVSVFLGYSFGFPKESGNGNGAPVVKREILKVALVADSHNENDLLSKALMQAKSQSVNFVIGLGDYTNLGTIEELVAAKRVFDESSLAYYVIPGDRDGWDSRQKGEANTANFSQVFGIDSQVFEQKEIQFVLVDNSDIYSGISREDWEMLNSNIEKRNSKLLFVFAHKTPFHPESAHIMGEDSAAVAKQAKDFLGILENSQTDNLFAGDMHFLAEFNSPSGSVKITTIGAVARDRNFQGPRFAVLKIYDDNSWEVEDIEIQ